MTNTTTAARPPAARSLEVCEAARRVNCLQCWQRPGPPCTVSGTPGDHLARYQRAERRGLITRAELAAVVAGLDVIAGHVIDSPNISVQGKQRCDFMEALASARALAKWLDCEFIYTYDGSTWGNA